MESPVYGGPFSYDQLAEAAVASGDYKGIIAIVNPAGGYMMLPFEFTPDLVGNYGFEMAASHMVERSAKIFCHQIKEKKHG